MTPEEREARRKQFEERMKNMTPEERAAFEERRRQGGAGRGGGGREGFSGGGRGNAPGGQPSASRTAGNSQSGSRQQSQRAATNPAKSPATTIDALFAPLPVVESRGRVWLFMESEKQLKSVAVRTGISDGTWTEIIENSETPQLKEGTEVVVNVTTGLEQQNRPGAAGAGNSPLMGPQRGNQGRGGPTGGAGGGRGR